MSCLCRIIACWTLAAVCCSAAADDSPPTRSPRPQGESSREAGSAVSFAAQVAPVLVENCLGCHGRRRQSAGLSLANFEVIRQGGQSGELFDTDDPAESLLIQKLNGTASDGQRMPLRRAALPAETIATITRWISEGTPYDGGDPKQPLEELVNTTLAQSLTPAELADRRRRGAKEKLHLALPDASLAEAETSLFYLLGDASADGLHELGRKLEAQWPKVAKTLGAAADVPPVSGQATILGLKRGVDFGEFARMVHKQELHRGQATLWHYDHLDAYAALHLGNDEGETELHAAEALAGLYLATQAPGPDWLLRGVAQAVAAKLEPKAALVRDWEEQAARTLAQKPSEPSILAGKLSLVDAKAVGYLLGKSLLKGPRKLPVLWEGLSAGEPLAESLSKATGSSLIQLLDQAQSPGRGKRKRQ